MIYFDWKFRQCKAYAFPDYIAFESIDEYREWVSKIYSLSCDYIDRHRKFNSICHDVVAQKKIYEQHIENLRLQEKSRLELMPVASAKEEALQKVRQLKKCLISYVNASHDKENGGPNNV